jgi:hypothetical protein
MDKSAMQNNHLLKCKYFMLLTVFCILKKAMTSTEWVNSDYTLSNSRRLQFDYPTLKSKIVVLFISVFIHEIKQKIPKLQR